MHSIYIHTDDGFWTVFRVQRVLNISNERSKILCFGCMSTFQLAAASLCANQTVETPTLDTCSLRPGSVGGSIHMQPLRQKSDSCCWSHTVCRHCLVQSHGCTVAAREGRWQESFDSYWSLPLTATCEFTLRPASKLVPTMSCNRS